MKTCSRCNETKSLDEFGSDITKRSGVRTYCRPCQNALTKLYRETHPERRVITSRRAQLKARYGMTLEQYDEMLILQDYRCACCGTDEPSKQHGFFVVDHNHVTDTVRGLLCTNCNLGIGKLGDSIEGVAKAMAYLQRTDGDG